MTRKRPQRRGPQGAPDRTTNPGFGRQADSGGAPPGSECPALRGCSRGAGPARRFAPTREALAEAIRAQGVPDVDYFLRSAVASEQGWRLLFDYDEMMAVQHHGLGDWWSDWLGSTCPALLLHGQRSTLLSPEMAHQMVRRRSRTQLVEFPDAGHWIHDDDPAGCTAAILDFLSKISEPGRSPG